MFKKLKNPNPTPIWISDFFYPIFKGGAEMCDYAAKQYFASKGLQIETRGTDQVSVDWLNFNKKRPFIFSNFVNINPACVVWLAEHPEVNYIIYEHDHKYCKYRNPRQHGIQCLCNCHSRNSPIIKMIKGAKKILCQSLMHQNIISLNIAEKNKVISLGCNVWSFEEEAKLEQIAITNKERKPEYIVLKSSNPIKNQDGCLAYANNYNIQTKVLPPCSWESLLDAFTEYQGFIFLSLVAENARVVVEARIAGCDVITNDLIGHRHEAWWHNASRTEIVQVAKNAKEKLYLETKDFLQGVYDGRY